MAGDDHSGSSGRYRLAASSLLVTAVVAALWSSAAETVADAPRETERQDPGADVGNPYADLSNEQLGALADEFEDLDRDQRRLFLTEVRKRMTAKGSRAPILGDERGRFGRVAREGLATHPDGGAGRDESSTTHEPADDGAAEVPEVYGAGFKPRRQDDIQTGTHGRQPEDPSRTRE